MLNTTACIFCKNTSAYLQNTSTHCSPAYDTVVGTYLCPCCLKVFKKEEQYLNEAWDDEYYSHIGNDTGINYVGKAAKISHRPFKNYSRRSIGFVSPGYIKKRNYVNSNRLKVTASVKDINSKKVRLFSSSTCEVVETNLCVI